MSDTWRDAAGRTIKQQGASSDAFSKTAYDGLGRVMKQYHAYDTDETAYTDASTVTGDTVLEQSEVSYDASGNVIQITAYAQAHRGWHRRTHHLLGAGDLTRPVGSMGRTVRPLRPTTAPTAAARSRPSSPPARSDTVLVTSTEYNTAGLAYQTTDPAGKVAQSEFDDAGRTTKQIGDYVDGNPATGSSNEDVTVEMAYNSDGQVTTLTAENPTTGDQVTDTSTAQASAVTPEIYRYDLLPPRNLSGQ